jgi:MerR family redox-sensitive transcriptional activator SoxR
LKFTLSQEAISDGWKGGQVSEELTIGEVARRAGVNPSTLRYYERIGLLPAPKRVSGQRRYTEDSLQMLRVLLLAQRSGFTIAEMQTLVHGFDPETAPAARWRPMIERKVTELDAAILRAEQMKEFLLKGLQCNCLRLEDCPENWDDRWAA